jgi:O-antigen/teichoic acid export membrane protein
MTHERNSYLNIIKTTSIFGGVQVIQILANLIRGKFVAIFLGTTGMGINAMLISVSTMFSQIFGFGLNFSSVREISRSYESGDTTHIDHTISVVRNWLKFCSLIGAFAVIVLSGWLSKFSFGNSEYIWAFIGLSLVVSFNILAGGNIAILQGVRETGKMAKATLAGSVVGLFVTVPLYYYFGKKAILPSLVLSFFLSFLFSYIYSHNIARNKPRIGIKKNFHHGIDMAKLGFVMMIATVIGSIVIYLLNSYISKTGSLADLGLYQAGTSITNQYSGVIFTAMSVDYFPRLSGVCNDRVKMNQVVNQQAEVVTLIIAPILMLVMLGAPLIIRLLLSKEFYVLDSFISIMAFSLLFKGVAFTIGNISFAKGDKKIFFWFEGVINSLIILLSGILGYKYGGLKGIAWGSLISMILYFCLIYFIAYKRFIFVLEKSFILLYLKLLGLSITLLIIVLFYKNIVGYSIGCLLFLVEIFICFKHLDKLIGVKSLIRNKFRY